MSLSCEHNGCSIWRSWWAQFIDIRDQCYKFQGTKHAKSDRLLALQKLTGYTMVRLDVANSQSAYLAAYWTTDTEPVWSESKAAAIYVNSRKRHFVLPLGVALADIRQLWINPSFVKDIRTEIRQIILYSILAQSIEFKDSDAFAKFVANQGVGNLDRKSGLFLRSLGSNPELSVSLSTEKLVYGTAILVIKALLLVLLKNPNTVLDRDYLMLNTRGRPASAHDRAIDVRMRQLCKKLSINTPGKALFMTIHAGGYMLNFVNRLAVTRRRHRPYVARC